MNKRIKKLWIKALTSGEYKQAKGQLRVGDEGFCCLGVLCELYRKRFGGEWNMKPRYSPEQPEYLGESYLLPDEVCAWSGLVDGDPILNKNLVHKSIGAQNDRGVKFPRIAELIDKYL